MDNEFVLTKTALQGVFHLHIPRAIIIGEVTHGRRETLYRVQSVAAISEACARKWPHIKMTQTSSTDFVVQVEDGACCVCRKEEDCELLSSCGHVLCVTCNSQCVPPRCPLCRYYYYY